MEILDCTLRDGGYYTNWNFSKKFVRLYITAINSTDINLVEIGYGSEQYNLGHGMFYYCNNRLIKEIRNNLNSSKEIGIMFNFKEISEAQGETKLDYPEVDFYRIAIDPNKYEGLQNFIAKLKSKSNAKIFVNWMYLHKYCNDKAKITELIEASELADGLCFVDSYGACIPEQVNRAIQFAKENTGKLIGFHGHDNLGLAAGNSLTAIDAAADVIDSTFTGMGRGAGNMRTEDLLLLCGENKSENSALETFVSKLSTMKKAYGWGSNYAYASAAAAKLPQKNVMEWLSLGRLSLQNVIKGLQLTTQTALNIPTCMMEMYDALSYKPTIIGGGESFDLINEWSSGCLEKPGIYIFISHRNLKKYLEYLKENKIKASINKNKYIYIGPSDDWKNIKSLAESVRVDIELIEPAKLHCSSNTLRNLEPESKKYYTEFAELGFFPDSPVFTALKFVEKMKCKEVNVIGFDGYEEDSWLSKETKLALSISPLVLHSPFKNKYGIKANLKKFI